MQDLSPLAVATIGLLCLIIILMNVGLIALFKYKPILNMKPPPTPKNQDANHVIDVMRDPFGAERKQIDELDRLVQQLDEEKKPAAGKE